MQHYVNRPVELLNSKSPIHITKTEEPTMIRSGHLPTWIRRAALGYGRLRLFVTVASLLIIIAAILYAASFFWLRHGLWVTGPDFVVHHCYLFSEIPTRNRKLVRLYRPMICFTGGLVEEEYNMLSSEDQDSSGRSLYLTEFEEDSWGGILGLLVEATRMTRFQGVFGKVVFERRCFWMKRRSPRAWRMWT